MATLPLTYTTPLDTSKNDATSRSGDLAPAVNAANAALNEIKDSVNSLQLTPSVALSGAGATVDVNYSASNVTITGTGALSWTWPANTQDGSTVVTIIQGGGGGYTPTFSGLTWLTPQPYWAGMTPGTSYDVLVYSRNNQTAKYAVWIDRDDTALMWCTSDLARVNTTTLANDPVLTFNAIPNSLYVITGLLVFTVASLDTIDLKASVTVPAGASGYWILSGHGNTVSGDPGTDQQEAFAYGSTQSAGLLAAKSLSMHCRWTLATSGTGGAVTFQWAQNSLDAANAVTRKATSYLRAERLG